MGKRLGSCGGAGSITPRWKRAAAGGLSDGFTRYSQIKYQVVVALFRDAVVEPHCSRDRGVTGYARRPPRSPGSEDGAGEGQSGAVPPPSSTCYCRWLGGGGPCPAGDPSLGPSFGQECKAQRSRPNQGLPGAGAWPRSRAAAGLSWALGRLQTWMPPALCPTRRGARAQGELGLALTGLFLFSAHDLPFLLGSSQGGDIQESCPLQEAFSPMGLAPCSSPKGQPPTLGTAWGQLGAKLPPCSWVLVTQAQILALSEGTGTGRAYKGGSSILWPPVTLCSDFLEAVNI